MSEHATGGRIPESAAGSSPISETPVPGRLPEFYPRQIRLLSGMSIGLIILLAGEWLWLTLHRPAPVLLERGDVFQRQFRVDINSAGWVEWVQLPGIGNSLAHRIVADRKINGPFASIDDLCRVPGIGRITLDRIRPWLTIRHEVDKYEE